MTKLIISIQIQNFKILISDPGQSILRFKGHIFFKSVPPRVHHVVRRRDRISRKARIPPLFLQADQRVGLVRPPTGQKRHIIHEMLLL